MLKKHRQRWKKIKENNTKSFFYVAVCLVVITMLLMAPVQVWKHVGIMEKGITSIRGNSMLPTIKDNEILYVEPVSFERGAIVVARCPDTESYSSSNGVALLKRIVGLPGETVQITIDGVLIDGELLGEHEYTNDQEKTLMEQNDINEVVLDDYEYFLLGDNRAESFDSRHTGPVHMNNFLYSLTKERNSYTNQLIFVYAFAIVLSIVISLFTPYLCAIIFTLPLNKNLKTKQKKKNNGTKKRK